MKISMAGPAAPTDMMWSARGVINYPPSFAYGSFAENFSQGASYPGGASGQAAYMFSMASGSGTLVMRALFTGNGHIRNGANAGTFRLQFAQVVAGAGIVCTRQAGAFLEYLAA